MPVRFHICAGFLVAILCWIAAVSGCTSFRAARHYHDGTAALDRGEVAQAVSELERAAQLHPNASEVHNHLGLAYQAAGRREDAKEAFHHAVLLDCGNAAAAQNLRAVEGFDQGASR